MNLLFKVIGTAVVAGALEGIILILLLKMLKESGALRKNYQGIDVPVSAGLSFPLAVIMVFLLYAVLSWYDDAYHLFILSIVAICWLGFIDDMLGQRDTLGFKGHLGALFRGRLTTGGLKAVGGGIIAFFVAFFSSNGWMDIILNTIIIALFTNMLNLLDLRPGRAIKGFLIFFLAILMMAGVRIDYLLISPLLGAILAYFPVDLKAKAMMGDAGSNVLGFSLGYLAITSLSQTFRLAVLVFLLGMHLYTEKFSLTKTIENNVLLKGIDELGRGK